MEKVMTIDIVRIMKALIKKWYFVALVSIVATILMYVYMYNPVQTYYSEAAIYSAAYGSYAQTTEGVKAVQLYADIIYSNKIAERAASILGDNSLDADTVRSMIFANITEDSSIMKIGARGTDPNKVIAVANAAAEAFIIEAQNITGSQGIQMLDKSSRAYMVTTNVRKKCILAFLVGAFATCMLIALLEIFSDRIYHVEDASLNGELEILGIIPIQKKKS